MTVITENKSTENKLAACFPNPGSGSHTLVILSFFNKGLSAFSTGDS